MCVEDSEYLKSRTNVKKIKMKNLKVISTGFVLMFFVLALQGQTEKGNVLLGGDTKLDITSQKMDVTDNAIRKSTFIELSPQIGFFVADGLAMGVELPISYSSNRLGNSKSSYTILAVSPFLRYYFGKSNIKPYLHGGAGIGMLKFKSDLLSLFNGSETMFNYDIGGGLGIFLNDKVSLDIGVETGTFTDGLVYGVGFVVLL